jgi:4-diphosphocytidyl-2-C-methyl-D-erythritol kinase
VRIEALAFAKLNLSLSVLCIRDDGFHEIDTVVQTIDLADRLTIWVDQGEGIEVCNSFGRFDAPDLAEKAARTVLAAKRASRKVRIDIVKQIPMGAGLGGGSSDAAATLRILDSVVPPALPASELSAVAAQIGSDVPLFLDGGQVRVQGRGERILRLDGIREETFVVIVPPVHCETQAIYRAWDEQRQRGEARMNSDNDLLAPALEVHPELHGYIEAVAEGRRACAGMSGSGAAFFVALAENEKAVEEARRLASRFPEVEVHVCRATDAGHQILRRDG